MSNVCDMPGAELNRNKEAAFFANNKRLKDVKESSLGYQYIVLREGQGKVKASSTSNVVVHYETRSLDGVKIDSSYERGVPINFNVSQVIVGWELALTEMVEGDKRTLFVPSRLAYGCNAQPPRIGYDEALIFDVELLKVH